MTRKPDLRQVKGCTQPTDAGTLVRRSGHHPQAQQTVNPYQEPRHSTLNPKPSTSLTHTNNMYCPGSAAVSHIPYGQSGQRWGSQGLGPEPRSRWCPGRQCEARPRRRPEPEEEDAGCWSCSLPGACVAAGGGS